jgi:hypothetical protein
VCDTEFNRLIFLPAATTGDATNNRGCRRLAKVSSRPVRRIIHKQSSGKMSAVRPTTEIRSNGMEQTVHLNCARNSAFAETRHGHPGIGAVPSNQSRRDLSTGVMPRTTSSAQRLGAIPRDRRRNDHFQRGMPIQSGKPSFRRFSAMRSRAVFEKTIACLYFETVRSG